MGMPTREHNGTGGRTSQTRNGGKGKAQVRGNGRDNGRDAGPAGTVRREDRQEVRQRQPGAVISMALAVIVFALGCIQLLSTVHVYVTNLNELNASKATEARLTAQKAELENSIARWDDKAYVVAQARDRLGFVFPGEKSVRVLHPEAVTGDDGAQSPERTAQGQTATSTLPWYKELAYSFKEADSKPLNEDTVGTVREGSSAGQEGQEGQEGKESTSQPHGADTQDSQNTDTQNNGTNTGDAQQ